MKTPAAPGTGQAGEIENKDTSNRSCSTPRSARQTRTIDVEPNWRHIGSIAAKIINDLKPGSS